MSYFFNQNFNVHLSVIVGIFLFLHLYHNEIKPYFHNKHTQILFYLKIYMEKEIKKINHSPTHLKSFVIPVFVTN